MLKYVFLLLITTVCFQASANFQSEFLKTKKGKSTGGKVQWTLADWLGQKSRNSLMDQWLALNSKSDWFEMNVGGASQQYKLKSETGGVSTSTDQTAQTYVADLYLSLLNLNGQYTKSDDNKESYGGAAGLRLLGASAQSTNLIVRYGWRKLLDLKIPEIWENQYAEGALQLYIFTEFGLTGNYRYYFPADSNRGTRLEGRKVTAGVFFEFSIFRISANYFQEPLELSSNGVVTKQNTDGFEGGLKLFF